MKIKKTAVFIIATIIFVTLIASPSTSFADKSYRFESISSHSISFKKIFDRESKATVMAYSNLVSTSLTAKIQLQEYSSSKKRFVNSKTPPKSKTVRSAIIFYKCRFRISSGKSYRIKVKLTDGRRGNRTTKTYFKNLS